jgi:RND superfamily putative drug exporter
VGGPIARRPWRFLVVALVLTLVAGALGVGVADVLQPYNGDPDPGAESAAAADQIREATGVDPRGGIVALVEPGGGARSPSGRAAVARVRAELEAERTVGRVVSPTTPGGTPLASRDGRATYLVAFLRPGQASEHRDAAERIEERFEGRRDVRIGGVGAGYVEGSEIAEEDLARAEQLVFPLLLAAAFLIFRGGVAAMLPLFVGFLSVLWTLALLRVLGEATDVSVFALNLVTSLALGLSIDFSLLLVSRFREELERAGGDERAVALQRTLATAGRTVLFSSLTIAAALASLLVFPQRLLYSLGVAGLLAALMTATLALVVVPACLALLGPRVNALAPRRLQRAAEREARPAEAGFWYRTAQLVARRPLPVALAAAALMLALAAPVLGMRTTSADTPAELPEGATTREVDDDLRTRFTPANASTPVRVVLESGAGPAADRYGAALRGLEGVVDVRRAALGAARTQYDLVPADAPFAEPTRELVRRVRAVPAPAPVAVGGDTAAFLDQSSSVRRHVVPAALVAGAVTLLVLFLMTGSVVLPVKTLLMNALTACATFGVLTLVFQHGWLSGLLGFESRGAFVDPTLLVYVAALAFGLSTDYAVMMLARIREAHGGGARSDRAVALGLERTGRIVTAAALLFAIAVGGAATSELVAVKEAAVGTVVAVILDATIVRSLLVPSLMALLGEWNWWAPAPLRRLHERLASRLGESPRGSLSSV